MGTVLKVVPLTQDNWATEELVLEELQVFPVQPRATRTRKEKGQQSALDE